MDGQPDREAVFSADSGVERAMPGGRALRGKRTLYLSTRQIFEGRLDDEMAASLLGFVRDWAASYSNQFVRVRAGAVAIGGRAILIPLGPDGPLPALVGLLVRSGAGYLGDDVVNIDPILREVHGLSLPLRIDAEDLHLHFPDLGREAPRRKGARAEASTEPPPRRVVTAEELGGVDSSPASPGWIVFPSFEPGGPTRLEPFGGAEALFELGRCVLNLYVWEDRALVMMRQLMESAAVSRLVVGSLPDAVDLLVRTAPSMLEGVTA